MIHVEYSLASPLGNWRMVEIRNTRPAFLEAPPQWVEIEVEILRQLSFRSLRGSLAEVEVVQDGETGMLRIAVGIRNPVHRRGNQPRLLRKPLNTELDHEIPNSPNPSAVKGRRFASGAFVAFDRANERSLVADRARCTRSNEGSE